MQPTIHKILIVEDDDSIRSVIRLFLSRGRFKVSEARNGIEGLGLARGLKPDLIITDLMLPGMDGVAMIRELKAHDDTKYIPIIAVTGSDFVLQQSAQEAGAIAVVQKPVHRKDLLELISSVLGS